MTTLRYEVISAASLDELEAMVAEHLESGYEPCGGLVAAPVRFGKDSASPGAVRWHQAMIKHLPT